MTARGLLRWIIGGRDEALYLDDRRLNVQIQSERRLALDTADIAYRNKVKRRMLLGLTSEQLPPLYRPARPGAVLQFPDRAAHDR